MEDRHTVAWLDIHLGNRSIHLTQASLSKRGLERDSTEGRRRGRTRRPICPAFGLGRYVIFHEPRDTEGVQDLSPSAASAPKRASCPLDAGISATMEMATGLQGHVPQ